MALVMAPVVRHMMVCDDAEVDAQNPRKINVYGLISSIAVDAVTGFPHCHEELCVYVAMSDGRGSGEGRIVVVQADSGDPVFASAGHPVAFGVDPLAVLGRCFRIRGGVFPRPGLYWVEFRFNGQTLATQPLHVKESS